MNTATAPFFFGAVELDSLTDRCCLAHFGIFVIRLHAKVEFS